MPEAREESKTSSKAKIVKEEKGKSAGKKGKGEVAAATKESFEACPKKWGASPKLSFPGLEGFESDRAGHVLEMLMPWGITSSAISQCGLMLALGLEDGSVVVWDLVIGLRFHLLLSE